MAELLILPVLWYGLAAGAVAFAILAVVTKKLSLLWTLLSGLSMEVGVLLALLQGRTLSDALPMVLAAAAIALAGLYRRGDGE